MHKRIVKEDIKQHNLQSKSLELNLSDYFITAGFNSKNSSKFKNSKRGIEVDVLAFKDNCLFVIELKTTYVSEDYIRNSLHFWRQINAKARHQMDLAIEYFKTDDGFNDIKKIRELKIPDKLEISQVKIVPLIVSNIFDFDDLYVDNKYLNVSSLELIINLTNDLYKLRNLVYKPIEKKDNVDSIENNVFPIDVFYRNLNYNNVFQNKIISDSSKEACNLWDSAELSAENLIRNINKNKVWNFLDDMKFYPCFNSKIGEFDKNKRFLI
jgi:Holliday junction resolvase